MLNRSFRDEGARLGIRAGTSSNIFDFGIEQGFDLFDGHRQEYRHIVVTTLEQHFTLELHQLVFAGSQQQSHQFVVDVDVNLRMAKGCVSNHCWHLSEEWRGVTYIEQLSEEDHSQARVLFVVRVALWIDHLTQFQHFSEDVHVCLLATGFCQTSGNGSVWDKKFASDSRPLLKGVEGHVTTYFPYSALLNFGRGELRPSTCANGLSSREFVFSLMTLLNLATLDESGESWKRRNFD